jgi:hypothetical protein
VRRSLDRFDVRALAPGLELRVRLDLRDILAALFMSSSQPSVVRLERFLEEHLTEAELSSALPRASAQFKSSFLARSTAASAMSCETSRA